MYFEQYTPEDEIEEDILQFQQGTNENMPPRYFFHHGRSGEHDANIARFERDANITRSARPSGYAPASARVKPVPVQDCRPPTDRELADALARRILAERDDAVKEAASARAYAEEVEQEARRSGEAAQAALARAVHAERAAEHAARVCGRRVPAVECSLARGICTRI